MTGQRSLSEGAAIMVFLGWPVLARGREGAPLFQNMASWKRLSFSYAFLLARSSVFLASFF